MISPLCRMLAKQIAFRDAPETFEGTDADYWEELSQPAQERYEVAADVIWIAAQREARVEMCRMREGWDRDIRVRNDEIDRLRGLLEAATGQPVPPWAPPSRQS